MIADLKPYSAYKDSGLTWLEQVPSHWGRRRMKFLFSERTQKGFPDEPLLAATQTKGVVRKEDYGKRTVTAMKDFHLLKLVQAGDFVISLRSFEGGIEVSHCRGIISPAYTVLKPSGDATQAYYSRLFKSADFIRGLTLFVTGIREGQSIDYERMSRDYLPLPPVEEQLAIGRFLDWANARLERTIRAKRRVIALLTEQKQAIIHRAVTRGLDPTVPLKPSGIAWLGDIPAHWEVMQLRQLLSFGPKNGVSPQAAVGVGVLSFSISAVRDGRVTIAGNEKMVALDQDRVAGFRIYKGDILLVRGNGNVSLVGKCGLVNECPNVCIFPDILMKLRPNEKMMAEYIVLAINSAYVSRQVSTLAKTSNGAFKVSGATVRSIAMVVPPIEEQKKLLKTLATSIAAIDKTISRLNREIDLLREYRIRLVADIVTGKLDVREAAARLPQDEVEAALEPDALDPDEATDADAEAELEE